VSTRKSGCGFSAAGTPAPRFRLPVLASRSTASRAPAYPALQTWRCRPGVADLALQTWRCRPGVADLALQTWHCRPGIAELKERAGDGFGVFDGTYRKTYSIRLHARLLYARLMDRSRLRFRGQSCNWLRGSVHRPARFCSRCATSPAQLATPPSRSLIAAPSSRQLALPPTSSPVLTPIRNQRG
jgi:hypothetical protein